MNDLSDYAKSVWNAKENGAVINPISSNTVFIKNFTIFTMSPTQMWVSTKAGEGNPCTVFAHTGKQTNAKDYFLGLASYRTEKWWNDLTR